MDGSLVAFPQIISPDDGQTSQSPDPGAFWPTAVASGSRKLSSTPKRKRDNASSPSDQTTGQGINNETTIEESSSYTKKSGKKQLSAATDNGEGTSTQGTKVPKKKKASRACFSCQRAHLTCDDSRPCQRCIKRGLADTCVEGLRKKAKYLLDEEELEQLKKTGKPQTNEKQQESPVQQIARIQSHTTHDPDSFMDLTLDPNYAFGSQTANLEYSMLSAILGNPSSDTHSTEGHSPMPANSNTSVNINPWPSAPESLTATSSEGMEGIFPPPLPPEPRTTSTTSFMRNMDSRSPRHMSNGSIDAQLNANTPVQIMTGNYAPEENAGASQSAELAPQHSSRMNGQWRSSGDSIYTAVTSGYDYTQGYHFLMRFLSERFEKNDILRVVRALAIFRPSLIALQMPMSEQDEIFVERALQRSLLELEKLISYSGTPTAIWRRTGEICVAGLEFTMLTGWTKEELVGQRKFIYELFENQSLVEYWEAFASHAFENSTQSVYSHCVLLKPSGDPVACAFCFTIRRNMFDLPDLVIGQWLPLF